MRYGRVTAIAVAAFTLCYSPAAADARAPLDEVLATAAQVRVAGGGSGVDEDAPAEPGERSGRLLLGGESVVRSAPFPATVLRLGGIYGPGRTRLIESVRAGTGRIRGGAPLYTNRIHRDDAAGAIAHLLALAEPAALYLGVDDEPAAEADVLNWLADQLGVPRPPVDADNPRDRLEQRGNKRCLNRRLRGSGYQFLYPTFREGYAALVIPPT